jgi:transposase
MPKANKPKKTWCYTNEFKAKAVQLSFLEGVKVLEVAQTLKHWTSTSLCCHDGEKSTGRGKLWQTVGPR